MLSIFERPFWNLIYMPQIWGNIMHPVQKSALNPRHISAPYA